LGKNWGCGVKYSSDWQQIHLQFPLKERKWRRFYQKINNPCGRIMKGDGADNNCYVLVYRPSFQTSKRSIHSRLSVRWHHLSASCGFHPGTNIR